MKKSILLVVLFLFSCSKENNATPEKKETPKIIEIRGADVSFLPYLRQQNIALKNLNNQTEDVLLTLKNNNFNTIRLRLWKNPTDQNSNFNTVKALASEIHNLGLKVLLTVHYSDTWADPGAQIKPAEWNNLNFTALKTEVNTYTKKIIQEINPDYIQIGNEINNGFIFPEGNISNVTQFKQLLTVAINCVRSTNSNTKIILHYAGLENANAFFANLNTIDYDMIGLSYYPKWHGKDLNALQQNLTLLNKNYNKPVFIAETSYPFTFSWNDYTNNIIGSSSEILPQFSATPIGQKEYLLKLKEIIKNVPNGIGICYWGTEFISFNGSTATNGSSYENQALWDFTNKALPAIDFFKE